MSAPAAFDRAGRPDAIHPLCVGEVRLENNLLLAPMAGVTNLPFRLIAREAGAALAFTETVSAKGLVTGGAKSWRLLRSAPRDTPLAYQLFGADPEVLAEACRLLADRGALWIDLNLGCPVRKFLRHGAGATLLRDPPRVGRILRAMRRAFARVLSIKMRTGWDERTITAPEVARIAVEEGVDLITVHGRTRAQQYGGSVDRTTIRRVVESAAGVPVIANGDLRSPADVFSMLADTGAAGAMIGRAALGNPWIFRATLERARGRPLPSPSLAQRLATVERHVERMAACCESRSQLAHQLKRYVVAYAKGLPGAAAFRERVHRLDDPDRIVALTRELFRAAGEGQP